MLRLKFLQGALWFVQDLRNKSVDQVLSVRKHGPTGFERDKSEIVRVRRTICFSSTRCKSEHLRSAHES